LNTFIYGLKDPITDEIRYVGKSNDPKNRLRRHIKDARGAKNIHRLCWIRGLLTIGLAPVVEILEEVSVDLWGEKENEWISKFDNLTNMIDGGKFCPMLVPEIAKRVGDKRVGSKATDVTKQKLSKIRKHEWDIGVRNRSFRKRTVIEKQHKSDLMKTIWSMRDSLNRKSVGINISKGKNRPVVGIDINGKIEYRFESALLAASNFGYSPDIIAKYCRDKKFNKNTKCFWRYESDALQDKN